MIRASRSIGFLLLVAIAVSTLSSVSSAKDGVALSTSASGHTTNVRVSPLGLLIGALSIGVDFEVAPSFSVGPEFSYWNISIGNIEANATGFGIRGNYFFGRPVFTQGWYAAPFLNYASVNVKDKNYSGFNDVAEGSASGFGGGAMGGYQWIWENFNINLGLGLAVSTVSEVTVKTSTGSESKVNSQTVGGLAGEFSMGWAF